MCGIRCEAVFEILNRTSSPVPYKKPVERLEQIIEAQNLWPAGADRSVSHAMAIEFYQKCLDFSEWEDVVALSYQYLQESKRTNNEYLKWLILSLLDVLEDAFCPVEEQTKLKLNEALEVILNFSSSKGKKLREIYRQAGTAEQFQVILDFILGHKKCSEEVRQAAMFLSEHLEMIELIEN